MATCGTNLILAVKMEGNMGEPIHPIYKVGGCAMIILPFVLGFVVLVLMNCLK